MIMNIIIIIVSIISYGTVLVLVLLVCLLMYLFLLAYFGEWLFSKKVTKGRVEFTKFVKFALNKF